MITIQLEPVVSGNIKAVGYDPATKTLDVQFASGLIYRYSDVPSETYNSLFYAESIGHYFAKNVRTKFASVKLEDVREESTPD